MARTHVPRQKMSTKKKITALTAVILTLALLVGGAFAWTDFSQFFINRFRGGTNADVLLHDDFEPWENKDVYVENTGNQQLIVRVLFREFFQVGNDAIVGGNANDVSTWPIHIYDDNLPINTCTEIAHEYFDWHMTGNGKTYLHGTSEQGNEDYSSIAGSDIENPDALGPNGQMYGKTAGPSAVITMEQWILCSDAEKAAANCWILDKDGWAYWSQLLPPGEATNMLLDNVSQTGKTPDDNFHYAIDVQLHAANRTEYKKLLDSKNGLPGASQDAQDYILAPLATVTVSSITAQGETSVPRGSTWQYTADIVSTPLTNHGAVWTVTGANDPATKINSRTGVLTVGPNETGALTVRATSRDDISKYDSLSVTVTSILSNPISQVIIETVPANATTVEQGGSASFTAAVAGLSTVAGDPQPSQAVKWALVSPMTGVSIDADTGTVTVDSATAVNAQIQVQATSVADSSVTSNIITLTVRAMSYTGLSVAVAPDDVPQSDNLQQGQSMKFTAQVMDNGTLIANQNVTWSIDMSPTIPGTVAPTSSGTKIASDGTLTLGANEADDVTIVVRATSTVDGTTGGTATVYVNQPPVNITGVTVNPSAQTLAQGAGQTFTATVTTDHAVKAPSQAVTWSVNSTLSSISASGVLTIGSNETGETITVTATSVADPAKSGTATVTVLVPKVTGVTISPKTADITKGEAQQFTAAIDVVNGAAQTVTWEVNSTLSTIDSTGKLTVGSAETADTLTVTVKSAFDGTKTDTATVTVNEAATGLSVSDIETAGFKIVAYADASFEITGWNGNGASTAKYALIITANPISGTNTWVNMQTKCNTWFNNTCPADIKAASVVSSGVTTTTATSVTGTNHGISAPTATSAATLTSTASNKLAFALSASEVWEWGSYTAKDTANTITASSVYWWTRSAQSTAASSAGSWRVSDAGKIHNASATSFVSARPALWVEVS